MMIGFGDPADVAVLRWAWALERAGEEVAQTEPDQAFIADVARWMSSDARAVWTVQTDGRVAGMVCLTEFRRMPSPVPMASGCWGYLGHLYVRAEFRDRGMGAQLVAAVLAEARSRNYSKVVLSPTEESIPLYERSGFRADRGLMMWRP
ncbi:MAG: GNAT family N-acetyltransferase [Segniliparus sp.]|uniref:GNAT family N-acetyltransferase n=1 Tax=Segniliparus sp. TaxID=2804064 RepID=UPI003F351581